MVLNVPNVIEYLRLANFDQNQFTYNDKNTNYRAIKLKSITHDTYSFSCDFLSKGLYSGMLLRSREKLLTDTFFSALFRSRKLFKEFSIVLESFVCGRRDDVMLFSPNCSILFSAAMIVGFG